MSLNYRKNYSSNSIKLLISVIGENITAAQLIIPFLFNDSQTTHIYSMNVSNYLAYPIVKE